MTHLGSSSADRSGNPFQVESAQIFQQRPALLLQAMAEDNRHAIAQVVLHGREQLVLLRPLDNLLAMSVLNYENQVTKPTAFEEEVSATPQHQRWSGEWRDDLPR